MINRRCHKESCNRLLCKVDETYRGGVEINCPKCGTANKIAPAPTSSPSPSPLPTSLGR